MTTLMKHGGRFEQVRLAQPDLVDPPRLVDARVRALAARCQEVAATRGRGGGGSVVVLTGAGLSTNAGVPDDWSSLSSTRRTGGGDRSVDGMRGHLKAQNDRVGVGRVAARLALARKLHVRRVVPMNHAAPTPAHIALTQLLSMGAVDTIVSTNQDGLHMRAATPRRQLVELCGNVNLEYCSACGQECLRDFDVRPPKETQSQLNHLYRARACTDHQSRISSHAWGTDLPEGTGDATAPLHVSHGETVTVLKEYVDDANLFHRALSAEGRSGLVPARFLTRLPGRTHATGRMCTRRECSGAFRDNLVFRGEAVDEAVLEDARAAVDGASVIIVLGSSLRERPLEHLVQRALYRRRRQRRGGRGVGEGAGIGGGGGGGGGGVEGGGAGGGGTAVGGSSGSPSGAGSPSGSGVSGIPSGHFGSSSSSSPSGRGSPSVRGGSDSGPCIILVNLQRTTLDKEVDEHIFADCDVVVPLLLNTLGGGRPPPFRIRRRILIGNEFRPYTEGIVKGVLQRHRRPEWELFLQVFDGLGAPISAINCLDVELPEAYKWYGPTFSSVYVPRETLDNEKGGVVRFLVSPGSTGGEVSVKVHFHQNYDEPPLFIKHTLGLTRGGARSMYIIEYDPSEGAWSTPVPVAIPTAASRTKDQFGGFKGTPTRALRITNAVAQDHSPGIGMNVEFDYSTKPRVCPHCGTLEAQSQVGAAVFAGKGKDRCKTCGEPMDGSGGVRRRGEGEESDSSHASDGDTDDEDVRQGRGGAEDDDIAHQAMVAADAAREGGFDIRPGEAISGNIRPGMQIWNTGGPRTMGLGSPVDGAGAGGGGGGGRGRGGESKKTVSESFTEIETRALDTINAVRPDRHRHAIPLPADPAVEEVAPTSLVYSAQNWEQQQQVRSCVCVCDPLWCPLP